MEWAATDIPEIHRLLGASTTAPAQPAFARSHRSLRFGRSTSSREKSADSPCPHDVSPYSLIVPRGRGGVGRKAGLAHLTLPFRFRRSVGFQERNRFIWCERVGNISKVQAAHQFLWAHIDQQPPNRFTLELCPQIPHAIYDRGGGKMNGPFSGPSQRNWLSPAVTYRQNPPMSAKISSRVAPTTRAASDFTAVTQISFPRPNVKVNPWPASPCGEFVLRTTYVAE